LSGRLPIRLQALSNHSLERGPVDSGRFQTLLDEFIIQKRILFPPRHNLSFVIRRTLTGGVCVLID
jgi:hypothetical protein